MTAFDDPRIAVPPQATPGWYFARRRNGEVPVQSFFDNLTNNLILNANYFPADQKANRDFFVELSSRAENFLIQTIDFLRTDFDLVPGTIFRPERKKFYAIIRPVTQRLGIRFAVYRFRKVPMWIITHAFFKVTRTWPESEFEYAQTIVDEVISQFSTS